LDDCSYRVLPKPKIPFSGVRDVENAIGSFSPVSSYAKQLNHQSTFMDIRPIDPDEDNLQHVPLEAYHQVTSSDYLEYSAVTPVTYQSQQTSNIPLVSAYHIYDTFGLPSSLDQQHEVNYSFGSEYIDAPEQSPAVSMIAGATGNQIEPQKGIDAWLESCFRGLDDFPFVLEPNHLEILCSRTSHVSREVFAGSLPAGIHLLNSSQYGAVGHELSDEYRRSFRQMSYSTWYNGGERLTSSESVTSPISYSTPATSYGSPIERPDLLRKHQSYHKLGHKPGRNYE